MPPLSASGDEQAIEDEAARDEVERLRAMSAWHLGAEILYAFAPGGATAANSTCVVQADLGRWLLRDYPRGERFHPLLRSAVREACRALVSSGLMQQGVAGYSVGADGEAGSTSGGLELTRHGARLLADDRIEGWLDFQERRAASHARGEPAEWSLADLGWAVEADGGNLPDWWPQG